MSVRALLPAPAALVAYVVVLGGGAVFGEAFPFSRYAMYADLRGRHEGARLRVTVNGRPARLEDYRVVAGVDPDGVLPAGVPSSQEGVVRSTRDWLRTHEGVGTGTGEELVLAWELVPSGEVHEAARGRIWR